MVVVIVIILLAVALCIISGFAARQMQDLRDNAETFKEQELKFENLIRENESLRRDKRDHETNLKMVLAEIDKE